MWVQTSTKNVTKPTIAQAKRAIELLKDFNNLVIRMERTALDLMYHPHATANQVMEVQQKLVQLRIQYTDFYNKIYSLFGHLYGFPANHFPKTYPT